jgi:hypothetical protein
MCDVEEITDSREGELINKELIQLEGNRIFAKTEAELRKNHKSSRNRSQRNERS